MEKNKQSIELANELFSALEEMINLPNKSNVEIFNSKLSDYRDSWMKDSIENLPLVQSIDLSVNSNKRPSISLSKDTINALDYIANISKKFLNGTDFERIIKALKRYAKYQSRKTSLRYPSNRSRDEAEKVERSITAKEDIALSRINDCGNFTLIKEIEFVESATLEALASGNEFNSMFSEEEIYRLKNSSIDRTIYSLVKQKITVNDDEERPFRSTNRRWYFDYNEGEEKLRTPWIEKRSYLRELLLKHKELSMPDQIEMDQYAGEITEIDSELINSDDISRLRKEITVKDDHGTDLIEKDNFIIVEYEYSDPYFGLENSWHDYDQNKLFQYPGSRPKYLRRDVLLFNKDFFTVRMFTKAITNSEKPRSIHLKSKSIEGDWYIDQDMPRLTGQSLKVFRDKLDLYDSNLLDNFKSIGKSDEDIKDLMDLDDAELRLIKEKFQNTTK